MPDTWFVWTDKRPGPAQKQGYPGVTRRDLYAIEGEIKHSMEGSLASAFGELDRATRQASWTFSVAKDGKVYQHYPLESITWHGGGINANRRFIGIEHEGKVGEPLTEPQYQATLKLSRAIREACPNVGGKPPARRVNLFEHREMTEFGSAATSCPSNRIPWARLIADLSPVAAKEDSLTPEQELKLDRIIQLLEAILGPGDNWIVDQSRLALKAAFQAAADAVAVPVEP